MANKVTIDVEARFIDNVTDEARAAAKSFDTLEKAAEGTQKDLKELGKTKVKPKVDLDSNSAAKKLDAMDKKLNKFGKSRTEAKLSVLDKATAVIDKVTSKAKAFGSKTYSGIVKIRDSNVLSSLNKMSNGLKSITSKAWTTVVKIKDTFTAPLTKLKNMLFNVKTLIAGIASAWAATQLIVKPISLADAYSGAKIGFSTLLGETGGQQMMDNLDEFAKVTPFKTSGVIANAQKMMAMGWDTETLIEDLEVIGNAAAATGKLDQGLESIVRALSQIKTKGKLSTEELNQLAEAGISAKAMLAENLGYGTGDEGIAKMTEDLENGAIQSNKAIEALLAGMHKYDGMMDSMANETVEGLWSQIQDVFEINIFRKWGQGLQDGAKRGFGTVTQLLDEAEDGFSKLGDMLYEIGKTASNWVADKLQVVVDKIMKITDTYEFEKADLGGKISMLWNGLVADPLKEWWEGGGREQTIETARDIGLAIGKAIFEAISVAWAALPWWGKLLVGGYGAGKLAGGISSFAGGVLNFAGGVKNAIGGFNIASSAFPILTSSGSGLLGMVGKAGVGLGASTTGSALLMGGAGIAGGVAGGAALIKGGVDLYGAYQASKEGNTLESRAKTASGASAIGGVAAGAAIGTMILPGLGTLIGAGIGGIAGWLGGNAVANKIRETDDAINDVTAATEKLETEEEKLAEKAKLVWQNMKDHFGDIKLSTSEIAAITKKIVWGDNLAAYEQFTSAAQTAEASMNTMKTASESINRWMWKGALGVKFTADELEELQQSFTDYITSAKNFVENKHYEWTAAVSLLVDVQSEDGKSILSTGNAFYGTLKDELTTLETGLQSALSKILADGVISNDDKVTIKIRGIEMEVSEAEALQAYYAAISEVTAMVADAEFEAELALNKVKFTTENISKESFDALIESMNTTIEERVAATDESFTISVASLQMQLEKGAITEDQYNAQLQALTDGYHAKIKSIKVDVLGVELDILGSAYTEDLGMNAVAKLKTALQQSLAKDIDPIEWTVDDARRYLNTPGLTESSAMAIAQYLSALSAQFGNLEFDTSLLVNPSTNITPVDPTEFSAAKFGIKSSYSFSPLVNLHAKLGNVSPVEFATSQLTKRSGYRGGIFGGDSAMDAFARGGIVGGSTRFIRVNEESPEMIIPLSDQRRGRALKLWAQAGNIMGVPGFARGGIVGGGGSDEGIRFNTYDSDESASGRTVQVNMGGIKLEINVSGSDKESIVEAIKAQAGDLADYIVGVIADSLETEFENTPVRGGAA